MELRTFGAVLTFCLEQEDQSLRFLERLPDGEDCSSIKSTLEEIIKVKKKHLKVLETTRRENVTEMILEPIKDLTSDDFQITIPIPDQNPTSGAESLRISMEIEQAASGFFRKASEKINLNEEARTMSRLHHEKEKLVEKLRDFL